MHQVTIALSSWETETTIQFLFYSPSLSKIVNLSPKSTNPQPNNPKLAA